MEQVANALRNNRAHPIDREVVGAHILGRAAALADIVIVALDDGDRQDVIKATKEERARRELGSGEGPVAACVKPLPSHVHGAAEHDPAGTWSGLHAPVMVTPRAMSAALDEAQARIAQLETETAAQHAKLEAARLAEIERDAEFQEVGARLDACGIPRADEQGAGLSTAERVRLAATCAARGWNVAEVRTRKEVRQPVKIGRVADHSDPIFRPAAERALAAMDPAIAGLVETLKEEAEDFEISPPGQVPITLTKRANVPAILRRIKARLVDLAREAVAVGAPPSVLGHLHEARQRVEDAVLDIEGAPPLAPSSEPRGPGPMPGCQVVRTCDLCMTTLEWQRDGHRLAFTKHDAEFCADGVRLRIRSVERLLADRERDLADSERRRHIFARMLDSLGRVVKGAEDVVAGRRDRDHLKRVLDEERECAGRARDAAPPAQAAPRLVVDDAGTARGISDADVRARAAAWHRETGITATQLPMRDGDILAADRFADIAHNPAIRALATESVMREMVSGAQTARWILGVDKGSPEGSQTKLFLVRVDGGKVTGTAELETLAISDSRIRKLMQDRAALGDDRSVEAAEIALRSEGTPTMSVGEARAYLVRVWNERAAREIQIGIGWF
jgi:hypothetical protein